MGVDEGDKVTVIVPAHGVAYEGAVVVELIDTLAQHLKGMGVIAVTAVMMRDRQAPVVKQ